MDPQLLARALADVPDRPRWIEARALLLSDHCSLFGADGRYVIRNDAPDGSLAVVFGRPDSALLAAAISNRTSRELMCAPEDEEFVAQFAPELLRERALLYQLSDPEQLAPEGPNVRSLSAEDSLAHLPAELREEMDGARGERDVWATFEGGRAVSFAYAYWRTEGQFDISIDTAPAFRRRGLARSAVSALIRAEMVEGRRPVWGAMASNLASQKPAGTLGFTLTDEIVVLSPNEPRAS